MMKFKTLVLIFLFFLLIDVVVYWRLWDTLFQQDEWYGFGTDIYTITTGNFTSYIFSFGTGIHYLPMAKIFRLVTYSFFGINAQYYAWMALVLHSITGILVLMFFRNITKNQLAAFLLAFLFIISYPARQPVVWFATTNSLVPAVILTLAFFILLHKFKEKINFKRTFFLGTLFLLGVFFKEDAFIIVLLMPLYVLFFWTKKELGKARKPLLFLLIFMLGIITIRFLIYSVQFSTGEGKRIEQDSLKVMTAYNLLTLSPKMVVQNIIEYNELVGIAREYTKLGFPRLLADGLTIETTILEIIYFLFFIPFAFLLGFVFPKLSKQNKRIFMFSIVWILICSFILAFQTRRLYHLESRYLFLGNIGVLLLIYSIITAFWGKTERAKKLSVGIIAVIFVTTTVYFYMGNRNLMNTIYMDYSTTRKSIIDQIKILYPALPPNTAIYIQCKNPEECTSPDDSILPFQSNVGQMLLVIYASENSESREAYAPFFSNKFLWDHLDEDYRRVGRYGYGYFRNIDKLYSYINKGEVLPEEIIALSYDKEMNKIEDISREIQLRLAKQLELISRQD